MGSKFLNFLKKAGITLISILILLGAVTLCNFAHKAIFPPTSTPTRVPTATTPVRIKGTIYDFLASEKIRVAMTGSGIDTVELLLSKLVEDALEVQVPVGTLFISEDQSIQRMVVRTAETIFLDTNMEVDVEINAACADYNRDVPNLLDSFATVEAPLEDDLTKLMRSLENTGELSYEYTYFSVVQGAVWIVTANSTYNSLGRLVISTRGAFDYYNYSAPTKRMINENEAARAMFLVHRAGIDIREKAIWQDRQKILAGLEEQALVDWIHSLE